MTLTFELTGEPEPEHRHRTRVLKVGEQTRVQNYSDPRSKQWRSRAAGLLRIQAANQGVRGANTLCGPVKLLIVVRRTKPSSYPATVSRDARKPDWDNYGKAVSDALSEAGVWFDDGCADDVRVIKTFADEQHPPGVSVTLFADPPQHLG